MSGVSSGDSFRNPVVGSGKFEEWKKKVESERNAKSPGLLPVAFPGKVSTVSLAI